MIITIGETQFDTVEIIKLYPVAIVGTGEDDETTHISLEWLETEGMGKVSVIGYAIVVQMQDGSKKEFFYPTREEFDESISKVKLQLIQN